jgi:hypothetical protein
VLAESTTVLAESIAVLAESITVLAESIANESEVVSDLLAVPLQEAKATVKANPKKANLNEFFILMLLNFIKFFYS